VYNRGNIATEITGGFAMTNVYKVNLVKQLEAWRLRDSDTHRPVGWQRWAKGLDMVHTVLFRFCQNGGKNKATLGAESLHKLAVAAAANGDYVTIIALAEYALGVEIFNSIPVEPDMG
jgi:hypothetical protein